MESKKMASQYVEDNDGNLVVSVSESKPEEFARRFGLTLKDAEKAVGQSAPADAKRTEPASDKHIVKVDKPSTGPSGNVGEESK